MNKFGTVVRTSEFWVALLAANMGVLVSNGIVSKDAAEFVSMAFVYVLGRIISKVAKAAYPAEGAK